MGVGPFMEKVKFLKHAVDKGLSMEYDKGQMESLMVVGLWC